MNSQSISRESLDTFLEDHRELMSSIRELREMWDQVNQIGHGPQYTEMSRGVRKLRDLLAHHFEQEEGDGYLSTALEIAPQFCERAENLLQQHAVFLSRLDQFNDRLADEEFESWDEVHVELEAFLKDLREHEAGETHIMQSSFNDDVGTGD